MAKEKAPVASAAPAEDRKRAIEAAMGQIEKMYGKGSIMRLGDQNNLQVVQAFERLFPQSKI